MPDNRCPECGRRIGYFGENKPFPAKYLPVIVCPYRKSNRRA